MPIAQNSATMMPMPMANPAGASGGSRDRGEAQMSIWQQLSATGTSRRRDSSLRRDGEERNEEAADGSSGNAMCLERRRREEVSFG